MRPLLALILVTILLSFGGSLPPTAVEASAAGQESPGEENSTAAPDACTVYWNVDADGFWDVAANWSTSTVPGSGSTACLDRPAGAYVVTIRQSTGNVGGVRSHELLRVVAGGSITVGQPSTAAGGMTVEGGMVSNGAGAWELGGDSIWAAGAINDQVTITGTLTLTTTTTKVLGGTLSNSGTVVHAQGDLDSATITNLSGGVYDFQGDALLTTSSAFNNQGTLRKSGGGGTSGFGSGAAFNNQGGAVEVTSGTLSVGGGGTSTGGVFNVSPGAALDLTGGGTATYSGAYTGAGGGEVRLASGTLNTATPALTLNFPAGMFQWTGGTIGAAATRPLNNSGSMTITGAAARQLNGQLNNSGTIMHVQGNLTFLNTTINNLPGGVYDFQGDALITNFGNFNNQGTLRKSGGGSTSGFGSSAHFNNQGGTVEVTSGTLSVGGGGTSTGGVFNVSPGAALDLTGGGTATYSGAYTGAGGGEVRLASGTLNTATPALTLNFPAGMFQWTGGTIGAAATRPLNNSDSMTITGAAARQLNGQLNNSGTIMHVQGNLTFLNTTINNLPGGVYDFQGDALITNSGSFNNQGTLRKSSGGGTSGFGANAAFNNLGGKVEATAGTLSIGFGGGTITDCSFTVAGGATVDLTGGGSPQYQGAFSGQGAGVLLLASGTLRLGGSHQATFDFPPGMFRWTGGTLTRISNEANLTNLNSLTIAGSGLHTLNSVTITNQGQIIHTDDGTLATSYGVGINNLTGGLYDLQGDGDFSGGYGIFTNFGELLKSAGSGEALLGIQFNSRPGGVVDVESGKINLAAGSGYNAGNPLATGGIWNVAAGAAIDISPDVVANSIFYMIGYFTGSGPGVVRIRTQLSSATAPAPVLNFPDGALELTDNGSLYGQIVNQGTIAFSGSNDMLLRGTLTNDGIIRHTGSGPFRIYPYSLVQNNGLYDLQSDADFSIWGYTGPLTFRNAGEFRKSVAIGLTQFYDPENRGTLYFDNQGTVNVQTGTLQFDEAVTQVNANTLTGGTWIVKPFAALNIASAGSLTINQGDIVLDGPSSTFNQINNLASNQGSLTLDAGRSLAPPAGFVNSGELTLGPGSTLAVSGAFTQSGDGPVTLQIGGSPASGQYGRITASGTATLTGTLSIALANGYGPAAGQQYDVVTYPNRSGQFQTITGLHPFFTASQTSTAVKLNATGTAADLSVVGGSIGFPGSAAPGQVVNVSFTVQNLDAVAVPGSWNDSVYLSDDPTYSSDDLLLGRVQHTGGLAGNASYNTAVNAPLPGLIDGNAYLVVISDSQTVAPDRNRANNYATAGPLAVTVANLPFNVTTLNTVANNQDRYYRLDVPPAAGDVRLKATLAVINQAEVFVRYGAMPTRSTFDYTASNLLELQRVLTLASPQAGPQYILVHGREGAGGGQGFSLLAEAIPFAVNAASPNHGSNAGQATVTIDGAGFTPAAVVTLRHGGGPVATASVAFASPNVLYATFNLAGVTSGAYDVHVADSSGSGSLAGAFQVTSGPTGVLEASISSPGSVRSGRPYIARVHYHNAGETDLAAPLFLLTASNARLKLPEQRDYNGNQLLLVGVSADGPAGVLAPDESGSIEVLFIASGTTTFNLDVPSASQPIDWMSLKSQLRPASMATDAWDAIYENFMARMGATMDQLQQALAEQATYLSRFGIVTADQNRLLRFALRLSDPASVIQQRYFLGAMGRGTVGLDDVKLDVYPNGDVAVRYGSLARWFVRQTNGSFLPAPGDHGTLTKAGSIYKLSDIDGQTTTFDANFKIDTIQAINGDTLTVSYSGGHAATLTDPLGHSVSYGLNGFGRIATVTDAVGQVTTLTYDGSGEHLLSVAGPEGTVSFSYVTGQGAAREHALASITFRDGITAQFSYDSAGRLTQITRGGDSFQLSYGPMGEVTVADPTGRQSTQWLDDGGYTLRVREPAGGLMDKSYDDLHNLTRLAGLGGLASTFEYDALDNMIRAVNPLGYSVGLNFHPTLNVLTTVEDSRYNLSAITYDESANATSVVHPDGATETFGYDTPGNLTTVTNREHQQMQITYDGANLPVQRTYADGTVMTYTYDSHRNLLTATRTGSAGIYTVTFIYDSGNRVTSVTYPGGRSLTYTYDSYGRRTEVVDNTGFAARYTYDAAGRLAQVRDAANALLASYTYDGANRLTQKTLGNGATSAYAYDAVGRLTSIVHRNASSAEFARANYTYDSLDRRTSMTTAAGTTTYSYDALSRLISTTLPGGRTISYSYDANGNRIALQDSAVGQPVLYTVNNRDQYTAVGDAALSYDPDGNMVEVTDNSGVTTYTWNDDQLIAISAPGDQWQFEYDALGFRIATIHNGQRTEHLIDPFGLGFVFADYDGAGALQAHYVRGLGMVGQNIGGSAQYYAFDGSGNTVAVTDQASAVLNSYRYLPFGESLAVSETVPSPFKFGGAYGMRDGGNGQLWTGVRQYSPAFGRFLSEEPMFPVVVNSYVYAANDPVNMVDATGYEPQTSWGDIASDPGFVKDVSESIIDNTVDNAWDDVRNWEPAKTMEDGLSASGRSLPDQARIGSQNYEDALQKGLNYSDAHAGKLAKGLGVLGNALDAVDVYDASTGLWQNGADYVSGKKDATDFYHDWGVNGGKLLVTAMRVPYGTTIVDAVDVGSYSLFEWAFRPNETDPSQVFGPRYDLLRGRSTSVVVASHDPNDLIGPAGFGAPRWIVAQTLDYSIRFENVAAASAPAQEVVITQQLDADLDWNSFEVGSFGWGDVYVPVPPGRQFYSARIDLRDTLGYFVDFEAGVNLATGVATWRFASIDPLTGDLISDPLAGFLPPNVSPPQGEGFINYSLQPKASATTGTAINAQASIVFDSNPAINTPIWINTLDVDKPASSVASLPPVSPLTFNVTWSGSDGGGSSIASYDVYVSDNGAPYTAWQSGVTTTGASYGGQSGHAYGFYSVATDNAGNRQATPAAAQATTVAVCANVVPPAGVDIRDIQSVAARWGMTSNTPGWNPIFDLQPNGVIDINDIIIAAGAWGTAC